MEVRQAAYDAQVDTSMKVIRALNAARDDLINLLSLTNERTSPLTIAALEGKKASIEKIVNRMSKNIQMSTISGLEQSAEDMTEIRAELMAEFASDKGYDFEQTFSSVPEEAVRNIINRTWADGFKFSDRIWNLRGNAMDGINEILSSGITRGASPIELAKELTNYLSDPIMDPNLSYTTQGKKSITGRGTINYNALRLAKSEINNTYREVTALSNKASDICAGMKWVLGDKHTVPDICDFWATQDLYGLGAGVYTAEFTPIEHPNGNCSLQDAFRPFDEWGDPKPDYEQVDINKSDVEDYLAGEEGGNAETILDQATAVQDILEEEFTY
jgi:hypothetical protein